MALFTTASYESIADLLSAATGWLDWLGIPPQPTRLGEYERAIRELTNATDRAVILRDDLPALNNAIYEAHELVAVYGALAGKYDDALRQHLRTVAHGPSFYFDESSASSSNKGRNVAFELIVMGYLAKAGLTLTFDSLADASAQFQNRTLLFECKRPQSLGAVERRVKDALVQLRDRINGVQKIRQRGLVALDITKAMNPDFKVFVTQSEQGIDVSMSEQVDHFIENYMHTWARPRCNQNIGILIRLRQMSIVEYEEHSKLFHCQQVAIRPFDNCGALNGELLSALTYDMSTNGSAAL